MSVQGDIEAAIIARVEAGVTGVVAVAGPRTLAQIEGSERVATVYLGNASATRLEFGVSEWIESYTVIVGWSSNVARATRITEWEAFEAQLIAYQQLALGDSGVQDNWIADKAWSEAHDSGIVTMSATVAVRRID